MSLPDQAARIEALDTFLRTESGRWKETAPSLMDRVDPDLLRAVVEATRARLGGFTRVVDTDAGLAIEGPAGQVLAWAAVNRTGALSGLWIAGELRGRAAPPSRVVRALFLLPYLVIGWQVVRCWTAGTVLAWAGELLLTVAVAVFIQGAGALATRPWWARRPLALLVVAAVGSAVRLPGLGRAGGAETLTVGVAALIIVAVVLTRARRHRWPAATAEPLATFPLSGTWYVVQGGGRLVNHHARVPEQRAAIDVVRVGPAGSYRGDPRRLSSYPSYGEPVVAPCAGRVVIAIDHIEDQTPGTIRFAPPFGNRVTIDNGAELITVAHLRPGTVAVAVGDVVEAGRLLGAVGNSGNSSEPHLHLQADRDGVGVDLRFAGIGGTLYRGRMVRGRARRPADSDPMRGGPS